MTNQTQWLNDLGETGKTPPVDGLVLVRGYNTEGRPPEEVVMVKKAEDYGADAVFFEERSGRSPVAQAFVFVEDGPADSPDFAKTHRRLWSWGGVPLLYRKTPGLIQLFRCANKPDFISSSVEPVCNPAKTLEIGGAISSALSTDPWWNAEQLHNGTLWDNTQTCEDLLSKESAHKGLVDAIKDLSDDLDSEGILPKKLRKKLLVLSLLIAYLEKRKVFEDGYFARFLPGAKQFFEVLAHGESLVNLLEALEERFNGNVFRVEPAARELLKSSRQLAKFSKLIKSRETKTGQLTLWQIYSFADLPVELISHIYQLFVSDTTTAVYTPPFLVRLMLDEALSWERLDRLHQRGEIILDPSCGSGVFLVEAYKRLVTHWRSRNQWKKPSKTVLKGLLKKVHGIDLEEDAVELAAFSLCLALCDALEPAEIRASIRLFDPLVGETLHSSCFFAAKVQGLVKDPVGIIVGNPPFKSSLTTEGAKRSYKRYEMTHGSLPDKQLAYLFLHEAMEMVTEGGILSMLQQYNFLYNQKSLEFRRRFIANYDVREILDLISVRGLFQADTKVVIVVAEKNIPPTDRKVLHATFRRSGRADAQLGFDIDYYDLHWLPRELTLSNDAVWRTDLLGGGRILGFVDRLRLSRTIKKYAESQNWDYGEGFIEGKTGKLVEAQHLTGKKLLPSSALTDAGIDHSQITVVKAKRFKSAYTSKRFTPPMLLIRENMELPHVVWEDHYLTYKAQIVGICAPLRERDQLRQLGQWLSAEKRPLQAYAAAISTSLFSRKATAVCADEIFDLPYPETGTLDISQNEQILIDDVVDYYRELIRLGEGSIAMKESAYPALPAFNEVFTHQINAIYKKNPLRPLTTQKWPGVICQPYAFDKGTVDWNGAEELKDKLDNLLREQRGETLRITRIARIYDGSFIFLLKPDRLRYWLRSVALRDADETLADLRAQGF